MPKLLLSNVSYLELSLRHLLTRSTPLKPHLRIFTFETTAILTRHSFPRHHRDHRTVPPSINMDIRFTPQAQSRLLSGIPGEIRNHIMRLTLDAMTTIWTPTTDETDKHALEIRGLELLVVCKQLRSELTRIFWLETTFSLDESVLSSKALSTLANLIGLLAAEMPELQLSHRIWTLGNSGRDETDEIEINLSKDAAGGVVCEGLPLSWSKKTLCVCKFAALLLEGCPGGVLNWTKEYVRMLERTAQGGGAPEDSFHCWICAGRVWKHECWSSDGEAARGLVTELLVEEELEADVAALEIGGAPEQEEADEKEESG